MSLRVRYRRARRLMRPLTALRHALRRDWRSIRLYTDAA